MRTPSLFLLFLICVSEARPLVRDSSSPSSIAVVIMTYKRTATLTRLLSSLSRLEGAQSYHLIVTQSHEKLPQPYVTEVADLVRVESASGRFLSVRHNLTPLIPKPAAGDTSVDMNKFGSKRNAMNNCMTGIWRAFSTLPGIQYVVIIEDDVRVSPDILHFYEFCAMQMAADPGIVLASAWGPSKFRASLLLSGSPDLNIVRALSKPDPYRVVRQTFLPRTILMVLSWMITRASFDELRHTLMWDQGWYHLDNGDSALWHSRNPAPPQSSLVGCCWLRHAHDHFLEYTFQGRDFLSADIARVSQVEGSGMTEQMNQLNPIVETRVSLSQAIALFRVEHKYRLVELFPAVHFDVAINSYHKGFHSPLEFLYVLRMELSLLLFVMLCSCLCCGCLLRRHRLARVRMKDKE